ncbi:phospho-acceptor domain-containing protein [Mucilaginibacter frigoritolerans]|uniref:histidine kinase n=1 Tax=Mucilaginibacter frigoritolerans TaxID=652788 RepID=A0A562UG49_9SPHI|nr:ATP-binding protein [Mucilaginibacter frigoritolerans]TWJ04810.1 phospho-acceptor domain-containing protein [Mucilaginibacter frigoritolerans]
MVNYIKTAFLSSTKGKIIIASFLACFALLSAWGISRIAFKQMLGAVEKMSSPYEKMRLVNELTHRVAKLDQVQKTNLLDNPTSYYSSFSETKKLLWTIDTLKTVYAGDEAQTKRLNSLKRLLIDRDKLFINYLKVRAGLVNNTSFSNQIKMLNRLVNKSARENDSTVTITEKKTSTTTIFPEEVKDTIKDKRGFLGKLFGKKKQPQIQNNTSYKVVDEELNVKHDTLSKAIQDSIIKGMGQAMHILEKTQLRKSAQFINKETGLTKANNKLVRQILAIIKKVQTESLAQIQLNNTEAKNVVTTTITRISIIIVVFFMLTVVLVYFIWADITKSNRYRKELEKARDEAEYHGQAKHRFLSNMSHEIRTPLQSIIGYTELIKQQEHPHKKEIDAIAKSSAHLMQIVNEVLDYNRIISGKFTFSNQVFCMAELLEEVISALSLQADEKGIALITGYESHCINYVEGDPFRLKQILFNILGNAIKFTEKGYVKLTLSQKEDHQFLKYNFEILDTGIGINEKDVERVFNEFEQVNAAGSNNLRGTGLGLPISKILIENQGGHIEVKSKPGEGSCFTFSLKYKMAIKSVKEVEKQAENISTVTNDEVWIVDDDKFILELCSSIFKNYNIQHQCFNSPNEVLNAHFNNHVKHVFLDIRMPEMNGTELCQILRNRMPADVKIYALTAQVLPGERESVLNHGFDEVLIKPFKADDLLALISKVKTDDEKLLQSEIDLSKLEKMTFGDKRQLTKILKRFTEDCIDDIAELRISIGNQDNWKIILLLHRIAGRVSQIGAGKLAADFRLAEMEFSKVEKLDDTQINAILILTDKLQYLIKHLRVIYLIDEIATEVV